MILIIHNDSQQTNEYVNFLKKESVNYYSLSIKDIIENTRITDFMKSIKNSNCSWFLNNVEINFHAFSGIYHDSYHIDNSLLGNFLDDDKEYVRNEWQAYLLYRLNFFSNVVNPINHIQAAGSLLQFPVVLEIGKKLGFLTPEYYFSTNHYDYQDFFDKYENAVIYKSSLYDNFQQAPKNNTSDDSTNNLAAVVEYRRGAPVWVYVIGNKVMSTIAYAEGKEDFTLPIELEKKCIALTNKLGLVFSEIFIRRTLNNEYFLYYVSRQPNLNFSTRKTDIYRELTNLLENPRD